MMGTQWRVTDRLWFNGLVENVKRTILGSHVGQVDTKKFVQEEQLSRWVCLPDSSLRFVWDGLIMVLVVLLAILDPIKIVFEDSNVNIVDIGAFGLLAQILFAFDMVINFTTAIKVHGEYICDREVIARHYLSSWFPIDLLSIIPFDAIHFENPTPRHRLLSAIKLLRVFRVTRILNRFEQSMKVAPTTLTLIKLFLSLFLIWHWVACSYWFVQRFESNNRNSTQPTEDVWVPPTEVAEFASLGLRYGVSLFWALMTITGTGRDIRPTNEAELLFTIIAIVIGVFIYAFIIGGFTSTLSEYDSGQSEKRRKQTAIKEFLLKRNVPRTLRKQILTWFEHLHANEGLDNNTVMQEVHHALALEVKYLCNQELFSKVRMFQFVSSFECRIALVAKFKKILLIPNETVIVEGEIGEAMYVVASGRLSAWVGKGSETEKCVSRFRRGDAFGEVSLLRDTRRNASIIANDYCELLMLERADFEDVRLEYPEFSRMLSRVSMLKVAGWGKLRNILDQASLMRFMTGKPLSIPVLLNLEGVSTAKSNGADLTLVVRFFNSFKTQEERNSVMIVVSKTQQEASANIILQDILERRKQRISEANLKKRRQRSSVQAV